MISQKSIKSYKGLRIRGNQNYLSILPHKILQPYIANYFILFPDQHLYSDEYTILPGISSTIILSVDDNKIDGFLQGLYTRAINVGTSVKRKRLMLLIEFHAGGLYQFIPIDQGKLVDSSYLLDEFDKKFMLSLKSELEKSLDIKHLIETLDKIFIKRLANSKILINFAPIRKNIIKQHGFIKPENMPLPFFYSERQTRRLFIRHVGISPKKFSRIIRANYALQLIKNNRSSFLDVVEKAGYFDQPHFIHDFKAVHGITPLEYKQNMSVFYNDHTTI